MVWALLEEEQGPWYRVKNVIMKVYAVYLPYLTSYLSTYLQIPLMGYVPSFSNVAFRVQAAYRRLPEVAYG